MSGKLTSTLRGWVGRYGSEAAFVGRVALAALLPPGCGRLLSHGLEAACEYLQGKSDVISDHDLAERLDSMGVPRDQLNTAISRIDHDGQVALDRVYQARRSGIAEAEVVSQLRELIASDPTLSALQNSMNEIADQLRTIEAQGELLIAGQHYQTAAIEEMMSMMRAIAAQVGIATVEVQPIPTPVQLAAPSTSSPSEHLLDSPARSHLQSSDALSLLDTSMTPRISSTDILSLVRSPVTPSTSTSDALSLLGSSVTPQTSSADVLSSLDSSVRSQNKSSAPLLSSSLFTQGSVTSADQPQREAQDLVERFMAQQRARSQPTHLDRNQAVALVRRFKDQLAARQMDQTEESSHLGNGRVSLTLIQVGPSPIMVVKWLCEEWGYSLQDAIIVTQSTPCIVRRDDNFVMLGQARNTLEKLGAQLKLVV